MNYLLTRIASLVLAFGFFIGCSALKSNQEVETKSQELTETELEKRIDTLNKEITAGDSSADLFYQKGYYLVQLAQKKDDPSNRSELYRDTQKSLQKSINKYEVSAEGNQQDSARQLLSVTWSNEHNSGVKIMQSDSTNSSPDYMRAAAHFKNATIIIPDSVISYKMEARAHYQSQNPDQAIATLEKARSNIKEVPSLLLEQLAYLYLEQDRPKEAVRIYEEAESFSNQNLNLIHGLSNAYIAADEHQKAINLLQKLVDEEPENIIYRQSLATELYYLSSKKIDSLVNRSGNELTKESNGVFQSVDSLLRRAEGHFSQLVDQNPEHQELKHRFAQFFHNSASKYQQLLAIVDEEAKADVENRIEYFLSSSLPLFEELTNQDPQEKSYWKNLYQAYSYLGMEEKAQEAKSNL